MVIAQRRLQLRISWLDRYNGNQLLEEVVTMDELLSPLLTAAWSRRVGLGVLIFMTVLLLVTFLQMIFAWRSDLKLAYQHVTEDRHYSPGGDQLVSLIAKIPEWHLFGKYGAAEQSAILPVTSLQIHLIGVIKATPDKYSRVIIAEASQPGRVYEVGDTLPSSGVKIYAITQDAVILNNSGRLEQLPLPRTPLSFQGMPKSLLGE